MRCTNPRPVGFQSDGKTLCWSSNKYSKEYAPFQLPCGKCISCRLIQAREKSIRCIHEASLHKNNSFITLTYSDENLESEKLIYEHAQKFIRDLRYRFPENPIPVVTTGEYGSKNKRPHFHLLLFNFAPSDSQFLKTNKYGDSLYTSKIIDDIWARNCPKNSPTLIGPVNINTAGYVCRYQLKKLELGEGFDPIVRYSSKYAIGKGWIEKNWQQTFGLGYIRLQTGEITKIPRYYEKWLKEHHPFEFEKYVFNIRGPAQKKFGAVADQEHLEQLERNFKRAALKGLEKSKNQMRAEIVEQRSKKFKQEL